MATDALSRAFSALADPTRRDMVTRLSMADATVSELAQPYDITLQAVYKHLTVLQGAGLVSRLPQAQPRPIHLEAEALDRMANWIELYRRRAEDRFRRLDEVLGSMPDAQEPHPSSRSPEGGTPGDDQRLRH